jgi:hypothetical protein
MKINLKNNPLLVTIFVGLVILLMPILFTRAWGYYKFDDSTGVIGDTIGGLTAPFIGLFSAYLVYKSFQAQIEANRMLADSRREDLIIANINAWLDKIDSLVNTYNYKGLIGTPAITSVITTVYSRVKSFEEEHKTGIKKNWEGVFDGLPHEDINTILKYISNINSLLRYIRNKKIDIELYEVSITHIQHLLDVNFNKIIPILGIITRNKDNGIQALPPYSGLINIETTYELIRILKKE